MSMSTNIDDLPGPVEEMDDQVEHPQNIRDDTRYGYDRDESTHFPVHNNISAHIQKMMPEIRDEFENNEGGFDIVTNEFTSNNLLLFLILYAATLPQTDMYMQKLTTILPVNFKSPLMVAGLKSLLLVIIYIMIKKFLI